MKTKNIISALFATVVTSGLFAQGISLQSDLQNPTCYGDHNGSISVTPNGGVGPYRYLWSVEGGQSSITDLPAGSYELTVIDDQGNTATQTFELTQPAPVTIEGSVTKVTNFGGSDGAIDLNVSGLTPAYTVIWSSNHGSGIEQGVLDQTGLTAGVYKVDIITEGGCTNTKSFILSQKLPRYVNPGMLNGINSSGSFGHMPLVYPNPSNGQVNFRNVEATDLIEIYNQFGTRIQAVNAMEGTNLPVGNYNVVITHADGNREVETLVVR